MFIYNIYVCIYTYIHTYIYIYICIYIGMRLPFLVVDTPLSSPGGVRDRTFFTVAGIGQGGKGKPKFFHFKNGQGYTNRC